MSCDVPRCNIRKTLADCFNHGNEMPVLLIGIRRFVFALEFDTDREIVTSWAPTETGLSCMPGAPAQWNKLN